jgi:hypothetical protein
MDMTKFAPAVLRAKQQLNKTGELSVGARVELLSLAKHDPSLSAAACSMCRVLLEVYCAERIKKRWLDNANPGLVDYPIIALKLAKENLGRKVSERQALHDLPDALWAFNELVASWEFNANPTVFFSRMKNISNDEKLATGVALGAIERAVFAVVRGDVPMDPRPSDWVPDTWGRWAADYGAMSSVEPGQKPFWSWYIEDAFPKAAGDVSQYVD